MKQKAKTYALPTTGMAATRRYMELAGDDAASRHEALAFLQQLGQKLN